MFAESMKMINAIIPYPDKIGVIYEDRDVLKYLLMCYPIHQSLVR